MTCAADKSHGILTKQSAKKKLRTNKKALIRAGILHSTLAKKKNTLGIHSNIRTNNIDQYF